MKHLLVIATLALGVFGFASCNNGAYDADAKNDYSNVPNPVNPDNKDFAQPGEIRVKVDGNLRTFLRLLSKKLIRSCLFTAM